MSRFPLQHFTQLFGIVSAFAGLTGMFQYPLFEWYEAYSGAPAHVSTTPDSILLITKTRLFKYIENLTTKKGKFSGKKNSDILHIFAQNIDCGYSLETPRRGVSNEYP